MAHAFRLPFTLLRPYEVAIPVRPDTVAPAPTATPARDFPRREAAAPALPALWERALPRPEPFGSRRAARRRPAAAWPVLAAIAGDPLPEPSVEPADPDAWRLTPPADTEPPGWSGHEPQSPRDPDDEPAAPEGDPEPDLVTDCYEPALPAGPAAPPVDATGWLGAYDDPGVPFEPPAPMPAGPELVTDCYEPDVAGDLDDELATWFSTRDVAAAAPPVEPEATVESEAAAAPAPVVEADPVVDSPPAASSVEAEAAGDAAPVEPEPASEPGPVAPPVQPEPEPAAATEPAVEIGAEPAPAAEAEPVTVAPPAPAPKVPLHRREIRLPRPRPRRERRGGGRGGDVVGLRVGSSQLAAARVHANGGFELVQLARTPLAPGVVVGGEVREPDALAAALKSFFAEHKLPRRNVRLGVASSRIGVRVLDVPPLDDPRQLENAIRFRAQEEIPIPVAEAVLDHVVIGDATDADGNPVRRILVAFAHRDLVLRQVEACRKAGLRPLGVDLDAFALLRAVTRSEDSAGGTRALVAVAVGHERTILAVSDGEVCEFTRVLEWGGSNLDVALAHALDLSPSQANAVKHRLSLAGEGDVLGLTPLQLEAARSAARLELQNLAREIVSSLRYYQTRPGALDLGEILVTGGASQLPGALAELESAIGAPVRAGDPLARVTLGKKVKRPADAGSYAIAVGLGLDR